MKEKNVYGKENIINEEQFLTPDMGDYVSKRTLIELGNKEYNEDISSKDIIDKPISTEVGYQSNENVIIFKTIPNFTKHNVNSAHQIEGKYDGDTVYFSIGDVRCSGNKFQTIGSEHVFNSVKDYLNKTISFGEVRYKYKGKVEGITQTKNDDLGFRLLGINAPEVHKFKKIPMQSLVNERIEISIQEILKYNKVYITAIDLVEGTGFPDTDGKDNNYFGEKRKVKLLTKEIQLKNIKMMHVDFKDAECKDMTTRDKELKRCFAISNAKDEQTGEEFIQLNEILMPYGMTWDEYYAANKQNKEHLFSGIIDDGSVYMCTSGSGSSMDDVEYYMQGKQCQATVYEEITKSKEVLFMGDCTVLNKKSGTVPPKYRDYGDRIGDNPKYALDAIWEQITGKESAYKYLGFSYFGQDNYQRLLGSIYLKKESGLWTNLARVLAQKYSRVELLPQYTSSIAETKEYGNVSDAFALWTYKRDTEFIDLLNSNDVKKCDDRNEIQKKICGASIDTMKSHTVMLGDVMLMIPPTSIRIVSQTSSTRASFIRTKGSLTKTIPKAERILELDLYFNNEMINGIPYEQELPSGQKVTYHMNGLRALMAQFKFTPFLPITNEYINEVLNIDAIALLNYQINSVPNFPRTYQVKIQLMEFNYMHYLPELSPPSPVNGEDLTTNIFAKAIHWPLMRFYYQKSIQNGEKLSNLTFNSDEYNVNSFGQATALQPMKFKKPLLDVYVANEEALKIKKQVKLELEKNPLEAVSIFSKEEESFLAKLVTEYLKCAKALKDIQANLDKINALAPEYVSFEDSIYFQNPFEIKNKLAFRSWVVGGMFGSIEAIFDKENDFSPEQMSIEVYGKYFLGKNAYRDIFTSAPLPKMTGKATDNELFEMMIESNKRIVSDILLGSKDAVDSSVILNIEFATLVTKDSGGAGKKEKAIMQAGLLITPNWSMGASNVSDLISRLKNMIAKEKTLSAELILKNDKIFIASTCDVHGSNKWNLYAVNKFEISSYKCPDMILMQNIISKFGGIPEGFDLPPEMFNPAEDLENVKDNVDIETANSIPFDKYDIGYPIITNIATAYNNRFANLSLKAIDGKAPQFLGGTDSTVQIDMIAKDEFTVSQLMTLKRASVQRLIDYRKVLSSSPVKIDNEFTRFIGVNEVIIETLDITTIPNQPGCYNISLTLASVDRSIRNKEALQKTENIGVGQTPRMSMGERFLSYSDMDNVLSKVDLYPDLEMPTIKELSKAGFEFLQYRNSTGRIYPDPDFYFIYLEVFASEMYRNAIVKYFDDNVLKKEVIEFNGNLTKDSAYVAQNKDALKNYGDAKNRKNTLAYYSPGNEATEKIDNIFKNVELSYNKKKVEADGSSYENKANDYANLKTAFAEIMTTISTASIKVFPTAHVAIKETVPFGEAVEGALGPGHINSYEIDSNGIANDNFIYKSTNNKEAEYSNTLIALIKSALSDPIPNYNNSNKSIALDSKIQKVFKYISEEILKAKSDYEFTHLTTVITGIINARSAPRGFDVSIMNSNEPIKVPKEYLPVEGIEVEVLEGGKNKKVVYPKIYTISSEQDIVGKKLAITKEEISSAVEFGIASIEKHPSSYISNLFNILIVEENKTFLDPYYNKHLSEHLFGRKLSPKEIADREAEYIKGISNLDKGAKLFSESQGTRNYLSDPVNVITKNLNYVYNAVARELLTIMLAGLIGGNMLPTGMVLLGEISGIHDISTTNVKDIIDKVNIHSTNPSINAGKWLAKTLGQWLKDMSGDKEKTEETKLKETIEKIQKGLEGQKTCYANGFMTLIGSMLVDKTLALKNLVDSASLSGISGWYSKYNAAILKNSSFGISDVNSYKYYSYLYSVFSKTATSSALNDIFEEYNANSRYQRLYIGAAEDENLWIMHSFYDMIINNKRGTMARAFPTYYMLLIDEGREYGAWHLQDNFYNVSAISEFQVVRSRKIAADTAKIVMSNMFGTFTTDDENIKASQNHTIRDVFDSVFSPYKYFTEEYYKRDNAPELNRANLKPGARIHLRSGYGGDASSLPILFNGVVAEILPGDMMTIVCQGDGVELDNPSMFIASDAKDVADLEAKVSEGFFSFVTKLFNNLSTPKQILTGPISTSGGFWKKTMKDLSNGRFFNENPFGIVHFGDIKLKNLHPLGEVEQNIYEAQAFPTWLTEGEERSIINNYKMDEPPKVKVPIHTGSTYWNLMHLAASISPDFIASIDNFGLRSSIFFGQPRYYYAFKYLQGETSDHIVEKRKPFQQLHVITSYSDIISNGMKASQKHIRTVAVGHYDGAGVLFGSKAKTVGPVYVDID